MIIKDLFEQSKQHPTTVAVSLFACLVIGSVGAFFYLKVSEARIALLDERMKTQEVEAKKQKLVNRLVQDQMGSLKRGFDGLPPAVNGVRTVLAKLDLSRSVPQNTRKKLDETLTNIENQVVQLQAAIASSEALSKTLDTLVSGTLAEEEGRFPEAARLYRVAANAGVPEAQAKLARLYLSGTGVPKDPELATRLLESAALLGNTRAKDDAILLYYAGHGTKDAPVRAAALLSVEPRSSTQSMVLIDTLEKLDSRQLSSLEKQIEKFRRAQASLATTGDQGGQR